MKRVGAIEYEKYILPVGLVVAGYIILNKMGLLGGGANGSNNSTTAANNAAATKADLAAATSAGGFQSSSNSDTVLSGYATAIYQEGIQNPVDQDAIVYNVINVNTLVDLLRLIQLFATKQVAQSAWDTCSLLGFNCTALDLGGFLNAVLDAGHLATINNYLTNQGINFQF
jgi:hypothetical protein